MKLSQLLATVAPVTETADGYLAHCPHHEDTKPSLRIAINDEGKVLVKCRAGCQTPDVVQSMGLSMGDLFNVETDQSTVTVSATHTAETTPAMVARLNAFLAECQVDLENDPNTGRQAIHYARDRFGLTMDHVRHLGLGVSGEGSEGFDGTSTAWLRVPRLVVPFRGFDGVARAAQGRALINDGVRWCSLTNPRDGSGQWSKLAFFDAGTGLDSIYLTEGPGDGLTIVGAGFDALAIRGAALVNNEALLKDLRESLTDRRIVIVGDNDRAGQDFNRTLGEAFAEAGLQAYILHLPEGVDDVNDWRTKDPDAFHHNLEEATRKADRVSKAVAHTSAPQPLTTYEPTDVGNAYRLRDLLGLVRYSPEAGFYLYRDGAWEPDRLNRVRTVAQTIGASIQDEAVKLNGGPIDGNTPPDILKLHAWGRSSQTTRRIDSMIQELAALEGVAIEIETFDAHPHLLACLNGVVDLRTGVLQPHSPDLFISRRLEVNYNPDATAPRWESFLDEVFPTQPDLPAYMRRLVGYGITGETSEQCFVIHWGQGANGKSIFTEALSDVFEAVTNTTPFSTFEEKPSGGIPNDVAALKGARLVFASEGERGRPMAEAVIKRVTGRDRITARFMRKEFFTFTPTFLLQLATNFKPSFRGQDEGLWRRVKLIPWLRYFAPEERDHYLHLKLQAEAEGILAWAVKGAQEWYDQGLGDPPAVVEATQSYRETSDSLGGFFPGVLVEDKTGEVLGSDAYKAYGHWTEDEDLPLRERMTRRAFYSAMEERGISRVRKEKGVTLLGVRLAHTIQEDGTDGDISNIFGGRQ